MRTRLGFIGTGRITCAIVEGLCTAKELPEKVFVSPRNTENAARLAQRFPQVSVAESNQAVIESSACVFLAIVPQIAQSVVQNLQFKPDQTIISLVATLPIDEVKKLVEPAKIVIRAVPLPSVAQHIGPILMYPQIAQVAGMFDKLGQPISVENEEELNILWTVTALIAPLYSLMEETCQWATAFGANRKNAASYIASMFHAVSALTLDAPDPRFSDLAAEAATPGGLNAQALAVIRARGGYKALLNALDAVHARQRI